MKAICYVLALVFTFFAAVGCEKKAEMGSSPIPAMPKPAFQGRLPEVKAPPGQADQLEGQAEQAQLPRKIIYNAAINLTVNDFGKAEGELKRLIREQGGYVVSSEVSGTPGSPRSGHWRVRVPVARAELFGEAVLKLGELDRTTSDSQDVTEEYYDLEARIRNMKKEEERLLGHLEKSTGKLDDILKVEHELTRVRGQIERSQGRQNLLGKLSAMTTVTITFRERSSYAPPEIAGFGTTISRTFTRSWESLVDFAKALLLGVVAVGPWLIPLTIVGIPAWAIIRRRLRKPAHATSTP